MRAINRDKHFEPLVKQLTDVKLEYTDAPLFQHIRTLLCFSALVGFQFKKRKPLGKNKMSLPFRIFESSDSCLEIIFCLALMEGKDPRALDDSKDEEIITIFEEYANGGLGIIQKWLDAKQRDSIGFEAIMNGLVEGKILKNLQTKPLQMEDVKFPN